MEAKIGASRVADLKISRLRRRNRCEQRSVRLKVEQRRLIDAIKAAHIDRAAVNSLKQRNRGTDRIRTGGRPQRECAAGVSIIGWALENKIAAREMQPVKHFDSRICLKTLQCRHPGFENLDPANWAVNATLTRGDESGGPRSTDAPDEHEPGVGRCWGLDGNLGLANLVLANHRNLFHVDSHDVASRTAAETIVRLKPGAKIAAHGRPVWWALDRR